MKLLGTYLGKLDAIPREFISNIIADDYDNTKTYELNSVCLHDTHIYKCIVAITTAEEWTAEHWEETKLSTAISSLTALINSTFLKLSGGTMTGAISFSKTWSCVDKATNNNYLQLNGHKTSDIGRGSCLVLSGDESTDSTYGGGNFVLRAMKNNSTYTILKGTPDGTLTWGGNNVFTYKKLAGTTITGITNGSINTNVSYAIKMAPGIYYVSMLINDVALSAGETRIATTFQINGETVGAMSTLAGNHNGSGTFYPATAVAWSGGLWVTVHNGGTGELRISGIVNM